MACVGRWQRFITKIWLLWAIISAIGVIHPASTVSPTEHSDNGNHCPDVKLPDDSNGTCVLSEDCSKVTCTSPEDKGPFGHMVLTVQAHGCRQPLKATVTLESSLMPKKWSHTFEDGDKAAMPVPPGGPVEIKQFLKVELKKNGDKVNFKLLLLFESGAVSYNTTLLKGELRASKCAETGGHSQQCPAVKFLPSAPTPSKCISSHHCSKVECVAASGGHKLTAIFKIHRCEQPMTATVTLQQSEANLNWSHTFRDGEKAKLPALLSSFTGGFEVTDADLFLQVNLRKTQGNNVNFKVSIVGQVTISEQVNPVNVPLMEGESPVSTDDCVIHPASTASPTEHSDKGNHPQENCPVVKLPDGSKGTCVLSEDCSKVTCTSPEDKGPFAHMVLTVQAYGCGRQPLKATVTMESAMTPEKWSHTFEDGDKAAMPMAPGASGGPVQMKVFLKVELKKNGDKVNFKLVLLFESGAVSHNTTFLQGELQASKCGSPSASWFSRQSGGVKALVIIIPVTMVILLGLVVGLCCYRSRRDGLRFPVNIFQNRDKLGMQRLSNDL